MSDPIDSGAAGANPNAAAVPAANEPPLDIRRYRAGDEAHIIDLYERTFGRPMGEGGSERHWRWEFLGNPTGKQAILLAYSGEKLAAQYAALPLRVVADGRLTEGALSLDTATDEGFRGRGLFPKLARHLYADMTAEGAVAVFGFPNANSAKTFFTKLGWIELGPFPLLIKPLAGGVAAQLAKRGGLAGAAAPLAEGMWSLVRRRPAKLPAGLEVEEVRQIPAEMDALWERARVGKRMCVVRDRAYLQWRYVDHPDSTYRIQIVRERGAAVGIVVTKTEPRFGMRSGFILDVLCEESRPDVAHALAGIAERTTAEEGAQILTALMYPGSVCRTALERAGFIAPPPSLFPQEIHFGVCPFTDADREMLIRPEHWFVTWGDSDVV